MLQRSPTYVVSRPAVDGLADRLRAVLPARWAHPVVRIKNVSLTLLSYVVSRRWPEVVKRGIRRGVAEALGETFDIDTHFTPRYNPWDQRLCLVPDGDLFEALKSSRASVVTDTISRFTPDGIELASGEHLDADVVVLATGLKLLFLGGIDLVVDGERVDPRSTIAYKGMMLCGVPNLVMTFGYTNASWTLKADLTAEYVIRLLDEMERRGVRQCTPMAPAGEETPAPFLDFSSGYVTRAIDDFPRQGAVAPWRLYQNYFLDMWLTRWRRIDDQLAFTNPAP
jgi:cation diffusion facilitator CzcD-associated flavoprotein CzcO